MSPSSIATRQRRAKRSAWVIAPVLAGSLALAAGLSSVDAVRSGHRYHVEDEELACVECHSSIPQSALSNDRNVPGHRECSECHDQVDEPDECGLCHTDVDGAAATANPKREVIYSHKAHAEREIRCVECHQRKGKDKLGEDIYALPEMKQCTECHEGRKATLLCTSCHTRLDTLLPKDHRLAWTERHGEVSREQTETCGRCHVQEQDCDACHRGDNLRGIPHRDGFIDTHAFTFYSKTKDCSACHDIGFSCRDCHVARRVLPINHSLAGWRERHGDFAQSDMEACAACHDEAQPTCLKCH